MAAQDPSSPPKFGSVVACHWVLVLGVKAVDTNAIAAMLSSRAMAVATTAKMQSHVGAALAAAKKNEIPRSQQVARSRRHGNGLAELLLLIGVAWDPDLLACERHLHQT
tara:strand:+ start:136 stop:462 length:327 start_codon:yes stop_codon:yes gene_type:complete